MKELMVLDCHEESVHLGRIRLLP